jgi:oligoribonuclease
MLLWLDLETTGLEPVADYILEVAWTLTADDLTDIVEDGIQHRGVTTYDLQMHKLRTNKFVLNMHTKSGLLDELENAHTLVLSDIEDLILSDLDNQPDQPIYLAGASVHFDRAFIDQGMPRLAQRLHHRIYDTSSIKLAVERYMSPMKNIVNKHPHRAASDVEECLGVARIIDTSLRFAGFAISLTSYETRQNLANAFYNYDLGYGFVKEEKATNA